MAAHRALVDPTDGKSIEVESYWASPHPIRGDERALLVTDPIRSHSTFTSTSGATAGTVQFVTPNDNGSLILGDLIINTEKQNAGSVEVRWNDGTEQVTIFKAFCNDAPANLAIGFAGRVQGWRDAYVDIVTTGATDHSVFLSYVKAPIGIPYQEWDALR